MTTQKVKKTNSAMTPEVITTNPVNNQIEISGETIKPTLPASEQIGEIDILDITEEFQPALDEFLENGLQITQGEPNQTEEPEPEFYSNPFFQSHQFVKNGFSEIYKTPKFLVQTLLPIFGGDSNLTLEGTMPVTISENDVVKTAYARGLIVKHFDLDKDDGITFEVGFMFAYDLKKPVFKVFSGAKVRACSNLCIFQADDIQTFDISENPAGAYEQIRVYMDDITNKIEVCRQTIQMLKSTHLNKREMTDFFGQLLFNFQAVENIAGITCITDAARELQRPESRNYFDPKPHRDVEGNLHQATTSCWNVYNALTNKFAKKEILDQPAKVLSIFKEVKPLIYAN